VAALSVQRESWHVPNLKTTAAALSLQRFLGGGCECILGDDTGKSIRRVKCWRKFLLVGMREATERQLAPALMVEDGGAVAICSDVVRASNCIGYNGSVNAFG
jgi:hypothetical protein